MSDIKAKIKELEKLQKKVDFLKQVIDFPTKLKADGADEKEVLPQVCLLIEELLKPIIEDLEAGKSVSIPDRDNKGNSESLQAFTEEEIGLIKVLINRVKNPATKTKQVTEEEPKTEGAAVAWAKENQHLGGKKVKTMYLSSEVEGEIVSLNKPFAVIKLDNGKIHQATLDKIQVL